VSRSQSRSKGTQTLYQTASKRTEKKKNDALKEFDDGYKGKFRFGPLSGELEAMMIDGMWVNRQSGNGKERGKQHAIQNDHLAAREETREERMAANKKAFNARLPMEFVLPRSMPWPSRQRQ